MKKYLMAFDQGTTSSRCIIFDKSGAIISSAQKEISQTYPEPGWVEQNPMEIWSVQLSTAAEALAKASLVYSDISAIGITNQRETTVIWDKRSGKPVYNAIVWQCRRTSGYCDELKAKGFDATIKQKTGLITDAYFSATKIKWILDNIKGAREEAEKGNLLFGTVDTWLIWNLTKGKIHATDYTNASRTMLFNIHSLEWDEDILKEFNIPRGILPEVLPSSHIYGYTDKSYFGGAIPIAGAAGDQQAAMFGQRCFEEGAVKNTYGTGCFILVNTGKRAADSKNGLLTSIAWKIGDETTYALEGSVFSAGSAVQWLRDGLKMIETAADSEEYALKAGNNGGVYFVPAFNGLGTPHWDQYARGAFLGIGRSAGKEHFIRAVLESIAYQSADAIKAMEADAGTSIKEIKADGGASANNFLMQFQSDILNMPLIRPAVIETTALGAAYLAGLAAGVYKDKDEIAGCGGKDRLFKPSMKDSERHELLSRWKNAVERSLSWERGG